VKGIDIHIIVEKQTWSASWCRWDRSRGNDTLLLAKVL